MKIKTLTSRLVVLAFLIKYINSRTDNSTYYNLIAHPTIVCGELLFCMVDSFHYEDRVFLLSWNVVRHGCRGFCWLGLIIKFS